MRQAILDTSFIITASKQKIDFFRWLEEEGIEPVIPEQTINELEGLGAKLALKILRMNKFKPIKIQGKDADAAIINFAKKNPDTFIATLDQELKRKIKNRKIIIRGKKKLEVI